MSEDALRQFLPQVPVAYIGTKKTKKDSVCGTRTIWNGQFDVKHVDAINADKLLSFPTVFIHGDKLEEYKEKVEKVLTEQLSEDDKVQAEKDAQMAEEKKAAEEAANAIDKEKLDLIQGVIVTLETDNNEHFFKSTGKPKLKAVRALLPDDAPEVSQEDVDIAFGLMGE